MKTDSNFVISDQQSDLQIERIHAFLSVKAYWCLGIPLHTVSTAAANSLCFGVYRASANPAAGSSAIELTSANARIDDQLSPHLGDQVGFARVVTDDATFAWICDVYVEESARGQGLSKLLLESILSHPRLQGLRRICLATHDAHDLYKQFGFTVTKTPQNWLEIKNDQIYLSRS